MNEVTISIREDDVALRDELRALAPRLRRYAHALIAGHPAPLACADELVQTVLQRVLEAKGKLAGPDLALHVYALVTEGHRERLAAGKLGGKDQMEMENLSATGRGAAGAVPVATKPRSPLAAALLSPTLEEREALLLVVLEGFNYGQTARILKTTRGVVIARLARARAVLGELPEMENAPVRTKRLPPYLRIIK